MKREKKYLFFLLALFVLFVAVEYFSPQPIDWRQTYAQKDKIPYGTYALRNLIPDIFPNRNFIDSRASLFHLFWDDTDPKQNIIFITNDFKPDALDLEILLDFVNEGNQAFISSELFAESLMDTLGFSTHYYKDWNPKEDTIVLSFNHYSIAKKDFLDKDNVSFYSFDNFDTLNTAILGKINNQEVNFISVKFGEGNFYLHTTPLLFTNMNLVEKDKAEYASVAFSHLPNQDVIWDEYYKPYAIVKQTPLYVILNDRSLKWGYYLLLGGFTVFIIFFGKRTQRIIPVISPLKNSSLEFVETLGRLYYNKSTHKNIAEKKIKYLLSYIRSKYNLNTSKINDDFKSALALKSQLSIKQVERLFFAISMIQNTTDLGAEELIKLNKLIEHFYFKTR